MILIIFFSAKGQYYANLVLPLIMNHITVIVSLTIIQYDIFYHIGQCYTVFLLWVMPVAASQKTFPVVPLALGCKNSRMEL